MIESFTMTATPSLTTFWAEAPAVSNNAHVRAIRSLMRLRMSVGAGGERSRGVRPAGSAVNRALRAARSTRRTEETIRLPAGVVPLLSPQAGARSSTHAVGDF